MNSYIKTAKKNAIKGRHPQHRLGAVIVKGSNIISVGHNFSEVHAEVHAIQRAWKRHDLKGATLVVVRVRKDGRMGMSKPCVQCLRKLVEVGIRKVVYTNDNGEISSYKVTQEMVDICRDIPAMPIWYYK